jgi:hypothetical protein
MILWRNFNDVAEHAYNPLNGNSQTVSKLYQYYQSIAFFFVTAAKLSGSTDVQFFTSSDPGAVT